MIQANSEQFACCEVKDCFAEIFSACHRCIALLCWEHFQKNQTCIDHGKTKTLSRSQQEEKKKEEENNNKNLKIKKIETKSNNDKKKYTACPKCNGLYKRVKQHLHYCKSFDTDDEEPKQLVQDCKRGPNSQQFVTYLSQAKRNIKIMRRIPKGARNVMSKNLSHCIEEVVKKNDIVSWEKLTKFAYGVLGLPGDTRETRKVSLTPLIKKNLENYMTTGTPLYRSREKMYIQYRNKNNREALKKIIDTKLAECDVRGAIRILTSEEGLAPFDQDSLISLREKHPPIRTDPNFPSFDSTEDTVEFDPPTTVEQVEIAIRSFPCGSSGGIDGITPQHLKDMINDRNGEYGSQLLNSLAKLVDIMRRGSVPQEVCCWLYGASLIGFKKKDGGIRPVASGGVFRRITAKIICEEIKTILGTRFRPQQVGFGIPKGAEAVVHAATEYIEQARHSLTMIKLDFRNAFNTIHRDYLLRLAKNALPTGYRFVWQCYRNPSILLFGNEIIQSETGVQQGDPLGPPLFCIATEQLSKELKSSFNEWYLDDCTLSGSVTDLIHDICKIKNFEKLSGLQLNNSKCEILIKDPDHNKCKEIYSEISEYLPGIRLVQPTNFKLLGSSITKESISTVLKERKIVSKRLCGKLPDLSSHTALYLLTNCLGLPKLLYTLRTCATWKYPHILNAIDEHFKEAMEHICNIRMTEDKWMQTTLPIANGGLGVRRTQDIALPAFLSSNFATKSLVMEMLHDNLNKEYFSQITHEGVEIYMAIPGAVMPSEEDRSKQKDWDQPIMENREKNLFEKAEDDIERARLQAISAKESGKWLQVLPSSQLGTFLDGDSLRISVALRLGAQICEPHKCCRCGAHVDGSGTHGLSCPFSSGRLSRHHALNDTVKRALALAEIPSKLEPNGTCFDEDRKRPDGITLIPWSRGRAMIWDVTCSDVFAKSNIRTALVAPRKLAEQAEERKRTKYQSFEHNYIVSPMAFDTLGGFGPNCLQIIREIGRKIKDITGEKRSTNFLMQRLSIEIARGNAASVIGSMPNTDILGEIYNL